MDKEIVEFATLFKERDNKLYNSFLIGKIISPPPSTQISISPEVILNNSNLVFSAHLLANYERTFEVSNATINSFSGKIKMTDTFKKDDLVILIPSTNNKKYIVIDRAVTL